MSHSSWVITNRLLSLWRKPVDLRVGAVAIFEIPRSLNSWGRLGVRRRNLRLSRRRHVGWLAALSPSGPAANAAGARVNVRLFRRKAGAGLFSVGVRRRARP